MNELMKLGLTKNFKIQTKKFSAQARKVTPNTPSKKDVLDLRRKKKSAEGGLKKERVPESLSKVFDTHRERELNSINTLNKATTILEAEEDDEFDGPKRKYKLFSKLIQDEIINNETR